MTGLRARRDERGSLAVAVPFLAFIFFALAGLGIDGSQALNARGQAVAYAEEAARAGAQQVDLDSPDLKLVPDKALNAAAEYCTAVEKSQPDLIDYCKPTGIEPVSPTDDRRLVVRVVCKVSLRTGLLNLVGVRELHGAGAGEARPYEGIDKPINEP